MDQALNHIVEQSLNEIFILDFETLKFVYANEAALKNLEYTLLELSEMTPLDIKPPETHDLVMAQLKRLSEGEDAPKKVIIETNHIRKGGTTYSVEIHLQRINYKNNSAYLAFVLDTSEKLLVHNQLQMVIEGSSLGYVDWNLETGEYLVNDRWLEIFGLKRSDFHNSVNDRNKLIHPDDLERVTKHITKAIKDKYPAIHELRMLHADGHWLTIQASGSVVSYDSTTNKALRITSIYQDMSKIKQREIERSQYRKFFQMSPDIMQIIDSKGLIQKINPALTNMLGYLEEDVISHSIIDFLHPDDKKTTLNEFTKLTQTGTINRGESRFRCKDGSYRWLNWRARFDKTEKLYYSTTHDITEHKLLTNQLFKQEAMYRTLTEASQDLITQYDRQHRHTYANPIAAQTMDYPATDIIGKTHQELGFPADLCEILDISIETAFTEGEPNTEVFEMENTTGIRIVDWRVFPELSNSGEVLSVISVARDITEEKRSEDELQKMHKLNSLGVLAGGIAHDFNNILTILFGHISLTKDLLATDHPGIEALEKAEHAFHRATHLTSQLLTFAKGGAPVKEAVSITQLIESVVNFDLSGSKVKLFIESSSDLWKVNADKGQISQVFSNLSTNSNQAMPDGGQLHIKIDNVAVSQGEITGLTPGPYVKFLVKDEGMGINPKQLNQIFDPYFSTKDSGNGLGLATVYSIISKHNGHISVTSELGAGTIFTLFLPASVIETKLTPSVKSLSLTTVNQTAKIMIMDDEKMIRTLAKQSLSAKGYLVETAKDGESAIAQFKQAQQSNQPFDCLIMDLTIPGGLGGAETIKQILSLDPNIKAIVSSGYAVDPVIANYSDYGFKDVIVKPFTIIDLRNVVARVLNESN